MRKTLPLSIFLFFICTTLAAQSQDWVSKMQDPDANFYEVQKAFNDHLKANPSMATQKGSGYKVYKRWEAFVGPRVYPSGDRSQMAQAMEEQKSFLLNGKSAMKNGSQTVQAGNWAFLGPAVVPQNTGGAGRANFIRFQPGNNSIVYTGSPSGGLWKTINGGGSWATTTDNLAVIGCTDVAIDPTNTNIMYLATGDGEASDNYSIGVLKSTDAGATWAVSGLSWTITQTRTISKLLINPTTTTTILAATSNGVYRSTNSGTSWTQVLVANAKDIEFKPGDANTVYATSAGPPSSFYRSLDGGATWGAITSGLPSSGSSCRMAIAVTPADPNYVYVVSSLAGNYKYQGVYLSINSGTSFTTQSTTPDILSVTTTSTTGQGWYDLAIAASPTVKTEIMVAGVNIWKSTNSGGTWGLVGHWQGFGAAYVHADVHALEYMPGSGTVTWAGCDGGLFRTSDGGVSWNDYCTNMAIAQIYRIGLSKFNTSTFLTGWQDNGTSLYNGSWTRVFGGDGMECIMDHSNPVNVYASLQYGGIYKSVDGGATFNPTPIVDNTGSGVNGQGDWTTPYVMDFNNNLSLLVGKGQVYRTTNGGSTWAQVGLITGGSGPCVALAIAPSNSNYIYAARYNRMFVSTDGTTFVDRTGTLPVASAAITFIAISYTNPSKAWVTFSGYSGANKVMATTDAGVTWTNISTGLPNLPVNCIVYQNGSNDGIYVGTDVGIYWKDNSNAWTSYSTNLPNVVVNDMEIQYTVGKLRAATYGRGVWESNTQPAPPVPLFTANSTTICQQKTVTFTDQSTGGANTWSWTFAGGTPGTSTSQNPTITYNTPGTYNVTLVAGNSNGTNTLVKNSYITVNTCVGIEEAVVEGSFKVYPNPSNGHFTVTFNSLTKDNYTIEVSNALGQVVYTKSLKEHSGEYSAPIDLSAHAKGAYRLTINGSGGTIARKVLIY